MRFEVQKSTKRGIECLERLGVLYHEKEVNHSTPTPTCTLYTPSACVPHITGDLLQHIHNAPNLIEIPLPTM
jgi:hypothetical protein